MPDRKLKFKRSPAFRRAFDALPPHQRIKAAKVFAVFRKNIFDPPLDNHIIKKLTSRYKTTVRAVWIEGDLRATYRQDGDVITALDIGTHDIYR